MAEKLRAEFVDQKRAVALDLMEEWVMPPDPGNFRPPGRSRLDPSVVSRSLITVRFIVSGQYATAHLVRKDLRDAIPTAPQDLVGHVCINMRQATWGGFYA